MAVLLYRVVDLVEPDDAGLQTYLVLPGVFPEVFHIQIIRSDGCNASLLWAMPHLTASRKT